MADEKPEEKAAEQDAGVGVEADEDASKEVEIDGAKDAEETVADLSKVPRQRGHSSSISQQSKMRSSSFRASSGPLSPSEFPPEENTAPDIYRKQAIRIEELEKENKRLAKEASDGERRWKKAEEELEELRELEGDSSSKAKDTSSTAGSSGQLEKLVYFNPPQYLRIALTILCSKRKSLPCSVKTLNSNLRHHALRGMAPPLQCL